MSHNIYKDKIFFTGELPWHGIGTKLNEPATAEEAIIAAKLDYKVTLKNLYVKENAIQADIYASQHMATFNEDNQTILGIVSKRYQPIQNKEAFSFFDSVVGEKLAIYHTAGALGKGERIWILAKLPGQIEVTNKDVIDKYLLLVNSHDGTMTLRMFFTPIRVVCNNTLSLALSYSNDAQQGIAIRHTGDVKSKIEAAQQALGLANSAYAQFEKDARKLTDRKLTQTESDMFFGLIAFQNRKSELHPNTKLLEKRYETLRGLYRAAPGNDIAEVKETAWAAYNTVTYYADHFKYIERTTVIPEKRLKNIWFGSGLELKQRALKVALEI